MPDRRFPPPWTVEELDACFVVRDSNGQQLAHVRFEDEPGRLSAAKRFLLPLLACLLSACATPHWVKPEASKSDLAEDRAACVQAVQQPPPAGTTDQQQYEACMNAHGWKLQQ